MRKLITALALVAALGLPGQTLASSFEDGLESCSYPKMLDLWLIKPFGLSALVVGSVFWVAAAPWALLTARDDLGHVTNTLVTRPAHFTFVRPLGECPTDVQ